MPTTIVLIRHGKANTAQEGQRDIDRSLTKPGKQSLRNTFPHVLAPLRERYEHTDMVVLSSPALRACQTAEYVCKALGITDYTTDKVLMGDNPKAILATARANEHQLVLLVGHTPVIDRVSQLLCGSRLPFKPGAVACFDLIDELNGSTNLRWFVQGPQVDRWERIERIDREIAHMGNAVGRSYRAFVDNPNDAETLHSLRISIRTLRSLLLYAAPFLKGKPIRQTETSLRDLALLTSRLREYDVLSECIAASDLEATELMAALAVRRASEADRTLSAFASRKSQQALALSCETATHLPWKNAVLSAGIAAGIPEARYQTLCHDYTERTKALDVTNAEITHDVRKQAKQLRYIARNLPDLIGASDAEEAALRAAQDLLGELCDVRANLEIIESLPTDELTKRARESLEQLHQRELARECDLIAAQHSPNK